MEVFRVGKGTFAGAGQVEHLTDALLLLINRLTAVFFHLRRVLLNQDVI